ncbi:site-2 protease family protein [Halobacillus sp. H74]|uniref:site-2 protease family protein n=1 Tax=Halobacillus sp. H74 TaxID=3457436 RepID=UPI003FCDA1DC
MIVTILVLIFLVAPLSLFVHELGHVLPGLLFRSQRCVIHLGRGRLIHQVKFKKLHIKVGLLFFQGAYSINERQKQFSPWQKAWISGGGPLLNAVVSLLLFFIFWTRVNDYLSLFFLFNLYLAVVNIVPFSFRGRRSDGYLLLQWLKHRKDRVE